MKFHQVTVGRGRHGPQIGVVPDFQDHWSMQMEMMRILLFSR